MSTADWETEVVDFWSGHMDLMLTTECLVPPASTSGGTSTPGPRSTPVITGTLPAGTPAGGSGSDTGTTPEPTGATGDDRVSVHRIALASDVLDAELHDGNGNLLGMIEEVFVVPETGRLQYVAVRADTAFQAQNQILLIPLGALTVRQAEEGMAGMFLELLVEASILQNAPGFDALPNASDSRWDTNLFDYWSQHVPMTQEDLP
jgi:hypothetical protein